MDINYRWSCREVFDHYISIALNGLKQGSFTTEEQIGVNSTTTVEDVGDGYIVFKVHNASTPLVGVTRFVYEWGGSEAINCVIDWDNTEETWVDDIGAFAVYNPQTALVEATGGTYNMEYYSYGVDIPSTELQSNVTWAKVQHSGYSISVEVSKNTNNYTRTATITIVPKCLDLDDYLSGQTLTVYQDEGEYKPKDASEFILSQVVLDCSPYAQTQNITTTQVNISSVSVHSNSSWISASYIASAETIAVTMQTNTGAKRTGSVTVTAVGTDKTYTKIIGVKQGDAISDGTITVDSDYSSLAFDYKSSSVTFPYYTSAITTIAAYSNDAWITPTINTNNNTLTVRVLANNTGAVREGSVIFRGTSAGGGTAFLTIPVIQSANPPTIEKPIWSDIIEVFEAEGGEDYTTYRVIDENEEIIYNGRAYFIDGKTEVKLNTIFENYINETIDLTYFGVQSNNAYKTFALQRWLNNFDGWIDIKHYLIYNDWSYDKVPVESGIISQTRKLSTELDSRQLFIQSYFNSINDGTTTVHIYGNRSTSSRPLFSDFDVNEEIASYVLPASWVNNIWVHLNDDEAGTVEYNVVNTCKPFALYWLNRFGGYDTILLNKTTKETDKITNYDYTRDVDNNTDDFEKIQYLKEIRRNWSVKTDILNDEQSKIVADIATSPQIYLHILDEDVILPVLVTDSSVDIKQWRNNQRKRITYTFNLEYSKLNKRQ